MSDLAQRVLSAAKARSWQIVTAESCTGGLVAGALTDVPGSSAVFDRGFVTYSYPAKVAMLGVHQASLDTYGAVSKVVAEEMAQGALRGSLANVSVAITGVAGPGGSNEKPEGLVHFAVATRDRVFAEHVEFGPLGRAQVRAASVDHALQMLLTAITAEQSA